MSILFATCFVIVAIGIAVLYLCKGQLSPLPELTQDAFINLSQLKESTKEVKVILINPFESRVIGLTKDSFYGEEDFGKSGDCTFILRQPSQISKIYEILRRASLHANPASDRRYEPSEVIFIRLKNGELEKFFFERHYSNVEWTTGEYNNTPTLASTLLIKDLYEWAATAYPSSPCVVYLDAARRSM
jgi:hypothetical protein